MYGLLFKMEVITFYNKFKQWIFQETFDKSIINAIKNDQIEAVA